MNIIYIHTHDSGRVLSPYGYDVPTPNLQAFASDALVFRQAHCAAPTCSPSRAALLTGRYPHQNGMLGLGNRGFQLNDYSQHLVRFLNKHDYKTILCGIQHESGAYLNHADAAKVIGYEQDITNDPECYAEADLVEWDYQNALSAAEWVKKYQGNQAFFLSLGFFSTHREYPQKISEGIDANYIVPPFAIPDCHETREDYAGYLTSAKWFDNGFGLILEALKQSGHYDDSIIMFTTDHGIAMPFCKCNLFDTGTGVALIMRVPEMMTLGRVSDALVSQVDIFPTLCDLLNLKKPNYLEGTSFVDLLHDEKREIREFVYAEINFHTSYEPCRSIRSKRYKLIRYYDDFLLINKSNMDDGKTKNYYLANDLEKKVKHREALYDLLYDPYEKNNLIDDNSMSDIAAFLREKLVEFQAATEDPLLQGPIEVQKNWKINKRECLTPSSRDPNDYLS